MNTKKFYTIAVFFICIGLLSGCLVFLFSDYETMIGHIIKTSQKPYLETILRNKVFTTAKFSLLKKLCVAVLFLIPVTTFLSIVYRNRILHFASFIYRSVQQSFFALKNIFKQNTGSQNLSILIVILLVVVRSGYYLIHYDLQYDEMWSYNYFTAQPFYYPFVVSSNYPLYEVSTQLFKWLPFEMKINLRLPVLLAGIASCIALYACLKKMFTNHLVALGGMILFAFMPVTTFYMLYARGVMFSLLFSIVAIFSLISWLTHKTQHQHLVVCAFANAAGFYSMPTYLYLWLLLSLFSLLVCIMKFRSQIKYIVAANAGAAAFAFLLYLPIIAGSGLSLLLSASVNDKPFSLLQLWQYNSGVSDFFTGFRYGLAFVLLMLFLISSIKKLKANYFRFLIALSCALCLVPTGIYTLQNVPVTPRAIAFTGLVIPIVFSLFLSVVPDGRYSAATIVSIIFAGISAALISHRHSFLNWSRTQDRQAKELSDLCLRHQIMTCYDNSAGSGFFYNHPALEYYYRMNNKKFILFTNANNSLRYKPFSAGDDYDCIAYHLADTVTDRRYYKGYENKEEGFVLYIRNGK